MTVFWQSGQGKIERAMITRTVFPSLYPVAFHSLPLKGWAIWQPFWQMISFPFPELTAPVFPWTKTPSAFRSDWFTNLALDELLFLFRSQ